MHNLTIVVSDGLGSSENFKIKSFFVPRVGETILVNGYKGLIVADITYVEKGIFFKTLSPQVMCIRFDAISKEHNEEKKRFILSSYGWINKESFPTH